MTGTSRTVLASGAFDVLHPGHLAYLTECRKYGDRLVVAVTADEYVRKGPGRPMFKAQERAAVLRALRLVDEVVVVDAPSVVPVIEQYRPAVYAKGAEYGTLDVAGNLQAEIRAVEAGGGTFVLTDTMKGSSTRWLNAQRPPYPPGAAKWLESVRERHSLAEALAWFDQASRLRVDVYGERIIDEYVYVEPLGKSAKETLVAFAPDGSESWHGGGEIIADHLAVYCGRVVYRLNGFDPPVVKRRYVQKAFAHKVFQTVDAPALTPTRFIPSDADLVVCGDFGHGLFADPAGFANEAKWLALTVQSNSANYGYNLVTRWPRSHYVVADRPEAELAFQSRGRPAEELVARLQMALSAETAAVTLGHDGAILIQGDEIERVPALSEHVVDRMGAGDAFLAWTAPFARLGAPLALIGLIGSAAAALHVGKPGNPPLEKAEVLGFVKALMT